jgi:hypothetical protein
MRIETSTIKSNILFTTILLHTIIVVAAPACAACSILFINGKHGRSSELTDQLFFNAHSLFIYITLFSIVGILIGVITLYTKHSKKRYIVAFEFDDAQQKLAIFYKTYYNNSIRSETIPYSNIECSSVKIEDKPNPLATKHFNAHEMALDTQILFFDKNAYKGEISTGGTFWNKEGSKIRTILNKVGEIKGL